MIIATDVKTREELNEIKNIMEIFVVNDRIKRIAKPIEKQFFY